jgi:hypothetical protein
LEPGAALASIIGPDFLTNGIIVSTGVSTACGGVDARGLLRRG